MHYPWPLTFSKSKHELNESDNELHWRREGRRVGSSSSSFARRSEEQTAREFAVPTGLAKSAGRGCSRWVREAKAWYVTGRRAGSRLAFLATHTVRGARPQVPFRRAATGRLVPVESPRGPTLRWEDLGAADAGERAPQVCAR